MKKLFILAFVVLMAAIIMNRQRVYVRDPLATIYRNDVKQSGVEAYINYSNDVLLKHESDPGAYLILVQRWNKMPGTPKLLRCIHWMACLADSNHATTIPVAFPGKGPYDPKVTMTDREVSFVDQAGASMRVQLR